MATRAAHAGRARILRRGSGGREDLRDGRVRRGHVGPVHTLGRGVRSGDRDVGTGGEPDGGPREVDARERGGGREGLRDGGPGRNRVQRE